MDPYRFDDLARVTHALRSRRGLVGGALIALLGAALPTLYQEAEAKRAHRRKRRKRRHRRGDGGGPVAATRQSLGWLCAADADCDGAAVCVSGRNGLRHCKPAQNPDSCLGMSEACGPGVDCCGDLECLANDGFASCRNRPTEPGDPCGQDVECGAGGSCVDGECACRTGLKKCDDRCVDTKRDASFCGNCATACNQGEVCRDGVCRCGEGPKCARSEVCFDGLCALGGGGTSDDMFGWGGGHCAFEVQWGNAIGNGFCWFGDSRLRRKYGHDERGRDGIYCYVQAPVSGNCPVCMPAGGGDCRPQVTPQSWQIKKHCKDFREESSEGKKVDCVARDCNAGERHEYDAGTDLWVCRS